MRRSSRSDHSRIDLSAYLQGRVKACCRMVLDNNHRQVKIHLRSRCSICEVKELPWGCVCICYVYIYIHVHMYTHTCILESFTPKTVVHGLFSLSISYVGILHMRSHLIP